MARHFLLYANSSITVEPLNPEVRCCTDLTYCPGTLSLTYTRLVVPPFFSSAQRHWKVPAGTFTLSFDEAMSPAPSGFRVCCLIYVAVGVTESHSVGPRCNHAPTPKPASCHFPLGDRLAEAPRIMGDEKLRGLLRRFLQTGDVADEAPYLGAALRIGPAEFGKIAKRA